MSTFRFGLQKILELREQAEQDQARALADAQRREQQAMRTLEDLRAIRDEEAAKLMRAHAEARSVGQLRNLATVVSQISERVRRAEAEVENARQSVERSRTELVQAMTQRRVMDQLRDRKKDEWEIAQKDSERRLADEVAIERFQRRAAGNGGQR